MTTLFSMYAQLNMNSPTNAKAAWAVVAEEV